MKSMREGEKNKKAIRKKNTVYVHCMHLCTVKRRGTVHVHVHEYKVMSVCIPYAMQVSCGPNTGARLHDDCVTCGPAYYTHVHVHVCEPSTIMR